MAVWWQKTSSPPPSWVMKPKPFASLNHFTVPVANCVSLCSLTAAESAAAVSIQGVEDAKNSAQGGAG